VRVVLSHRIALVPSTAQEVLLRQAVGVSRFAYNWALAEWQRQYQAGGKPGEVALRRQLNALKRQQYPWMLLVPKSVPQQAIKNCGAAFQRFFHKQGRYPKFKKKGVRDSARLDNGPGTFEFAGRRVRLPVIGWVKLREELRFSGKALSATVRCVADRWFISVPVEVELPEAVRENQAAVGIDLGVRTATTLSSGEKLVVRKRFTLIWKDCKDFPEGTVGKRKAATIGANRHCGWPACTHASGMSGRTGCTRPPRGWCATLRCWASRTCMCAACWPTGNWPGR
jgi:transposase